MNGRYSEAGSSNFQIMGCSTAPLDSKCQSFTLPEANLAGIQVFLVSDCRVLVSDSRVLVSDSRVLFSDSRDLVSDSLFLIRAKFLIRGLFIVVSMDNDTSCDLPILVF